MGCKIDSVAARKRLKVRREPYWSRIARGRYIGFRRTRAGGGWIARFQVGKQKSYFSLGEELTFDEAIAAARRWFSRAAHTEDPHYHVTDAITDYVHHLAVNNSQKSALGVEQRLGKHVTESLLRTELARLTTLQLRRWLQSMVKVDADPETVRRSKDSANRTLSVLRAALNLAFQSGLAGSDREWRRVKPFKDVGRPRTLFLTDKQVKALLHHAEEPFRSLLRAGLITGGRYGELRTVHVDDFHAEHGTVRLVGKTGPRECFLSDDGVVFFAEQVEGKAPGDLIFQREPGTAWRHGNQYHAINEVVARAGLPSDTVFYSLRHFCISKALLAGVPTQVIAENCGTSVAMIEKHYGKFMGADRRAMLSKVALP